MCGLDTIRAIELKNKPMCYNLSVKAQEEIEQRKKDDRNITIIITLSVIASALFYTVLIIKLI